MTAGVPAHLEAVQACIEAAESALRSAEALLSKDFDGVLDAPEALARVRHALGDLDDVWSALDRDPPEAPCRGAPATLPPREPHRSAAAPSPSATHPALDLHPDAIQVVGSLDDERTGELVVLHGKADDPGRPPGLAGLPRVLVNDHGPLGYVVAGHLWDEGVWMPLSSRTLGRMCSRPPVKLSFEEEQFWTLSQPVDVGVCGPAHVPSWLRPDESTPAAPELPPAAPEPPPVPLRPSEPSWARRRPPARGQWRDEAKRMRRRARGTEIRPGRFTLTHPEAQAVVDRWYSDEACLESLEQFCGGTDP